MNKTSWLLAGLASLVIAGAAVANPPTPDIKIARNGASLVMTFPEGTMHRTVGWRVHGRTFKACTHKCRKASANWSSPTEITIDMAKAHRHHPQAAEGGQPLEMWIWGQQANGTQLLQKQTVQ